MMEHDKAKRQGDKTHEQHLRILERKDDMAKPGEIDLSDASAAAASAQVPKDPDARRSEMPVSRGGMNQESRDHNKHNKGGQSGHKPQQHSPAEEKH
jgi:hypothetical protein